MRRRTEILLSWAVNVVALNGLSLKDLACMLIGNGTAIARRADAAMLYRLARIQILLLAVLFFSAPLSAQTSDQPLPSAEQVDAYIEQGMRQLEIPGAAVALIADGKITHLKGFGDIDGAGTPVSAKTPFQLGSVSKSFAALVVLQLAEEGRLSLDDPVSKYIPYFRADDKTASDKITVRHLLSHRSGLTTLDGNRHQDTTYRGDDAMERVIRELRSAHLFAMPGDRFQYSNANYIVLAQLIETVEKVPYEKVVKARIFSKLGMNNSYVQIADAATAEPAVGHTQWFGRTFERNFIAGRAMMGPGGITASAEDLAAYLIAVFENDPRIMPKALSEALARERKGGYEFGWEFDTVDEQRVVFHGGLNPGFLAMVKYTPDTRKGALVLTNMSSSLEGNFIYGATDYALGLPPTDISPPSIALLRLWGTLGLTFLLAMGCVLSLYALIKRAPKSPRRSVAMKWLWIGVPSLFLFGLSYFLVFVVPQLSGVNLTAVRMFYPDLGLLLAVSSGIAIFWAVARAVLLIAKSGARKTGTPTI
ncbi:MAG: beta-lactamase family protein [Lysobacter sp.]|nr:beta-lactamase family protein [Lysobacter sp.]